MLGSLFCLPCNAAAVVRSFEYNAEGRLEQILMPEDCSVTLGYDSLNRLAKVKDSDGKVTEYEYDANNNRIETKDASGTTTYGYDPLNRLAFVAYPGLAPVQYGYDLRGRLGKMIYPGNIEVSYSYDAADRLTSVTSPQGITRYVYDNATNTLSRIIFPNGVTTEYGYDPAKRVDSVFHKRSDQSLIIGFRYTIDGNGNRIKVEEITPNGIKTVEYSYDKLNRLTNASTSEWFEKFTYDALGNRKTKETPLGVVEYDYDENNLLKRAGKTTFSYDLRGNLIKKASPTKTVAYTFDTNDNLIQYRDGKNEVIYGYDGENRRISKTVNGKKTFYINDTRQPSAQVLIEASEDKKIQALYVYGLSRLEQLSAWGCHTYLYDYPDRNVIALVDQAQNLNNYYAYEAFGALKKSISTISNPFSYAGEALEPETGLIFLRNRYYDPEIGRFISADPCLGDPINPQSFNPYTYVGNNPVNFIDPSGLLTAEACFYPAGTMTAHGKSLTGHGFWILTKDNGDVIVIGRYPQGARNHDEIVPGTVAVKFPATDQQIDIMIDVVSEGKYWGIAGNCIDGIERGLKVLGVEHPSFNIAGVSVPTKGLIWAESLQGRDDFKRAMEQDLRFAADPDIFSPAIRPSPTIIKPACPCGATSSGDFGGVSLNKTAQLIGSFTDIVGATYDSTTGQLILIGDQNYNLPPMDFDDLAVAVRSVYGLGGKPAQDPGVSIDPNPANAKKIEKNKLDSLHPMVVRYEGATEGTRFGQIMFEADRLLKCLTIGMDNNTQKPFGSGVPGYFSLPSRYANRHMNVESGITNRMWFVPQEITLTKAPDGKSIVFDRAEIAVLTEATRNTRVLKNEGAEAFAHHFTTHFNHFSQHHPILEELKRLGKITGIVKWMKENNIPLDLSLFGAYTPKPAHTPYSTPATFFPYMRPGMQLNWVIGGVFYHLSDSNFHEVFGSLPSDLQEAALASRPSEDTMEWDIGGNLGSGLKAVAHTVERTRKIGNVQKTFIDLQYQVPGAFPLQLARYYNSFNDRVSGFGQGWEISPALLFFPRNRGWIQWAEKNIVKNVFPEVVVMEEGREFRYILRGLDAGALPVYQAEDLSATLLEQESGNFVLRKGTNEWMFDSSGRLLKQSDRDGHGIEYGYENGRLITINHTNGKKIRLAYENGHIAQALGLGDKTIDYRYDANNQLYSIEDKAGVLAYYGYDADKNLSGIYDAKKRPVFEASYDDYHRAITMTNGKQSTTRNFSLKNHTARIEGAELDILNEYDPSYRLRKSTDSLDRNVEISYQDGILQPSVVKDSFGHEAKYGYDARGNVISVKNHAGIEWRFWYDNADRLTASLDGRGRAVVYLYDEKGRLKLVFPNAILTSEDTAAGLSSFHYECDEMVEYVFDDRTGAVTSVKKGNELACTLSYDEEGRLDAISDPYDYSLCRSYDNRSRLAKVEDSQGGFEYHYNERDRVVKITSPIGNVEYDYDEVDNLCWIRDANGNETTLEYDEDYNLCKVIDAEGGVTKYAYNNSHGLKRITLPNGSVREIVYDAFNRPKQEIIGQ